VRSFPPRRKMHTGQVQDADVELTPLMCLFMILVPLLLVTAVFERVTALKVNLPQSSTLEETEKPKEPTGVVELQVLLQEGGLSVLGTLSHDPSGKEKEIYEDFRYDIPLANGEYDLPKLQEILKDIKQRYPKHEEVVLLVEDRVSYDAIVQCMDTCREEFFLEDGEKKRNPIFPSVVLSESFSEEKGFEGVREGTREIDRQMGIR
jgi:biopolymer transport protein ExbD